MSGNREERKGERERKMQWIVKKPREHNARVERKSGKTRAWNCPPYFDAYTVKKNLLELQSVSAAFLADTLYLNFHFSELSKKQL